MSNIQRASWQQQLCLLWLGLAIALSGSWAHAQRPVAPPANELTRKLPPKPRS